MTAAEMPAFEALLLSKGHSPNGVVIAFATFTQGSLRGNLGLDDPIPLGLFVRERHSIS